MTTFTLNGFEGRVQQLAHCGSTNDEAFATLQHAPLTAVWTTHQASGRGSRGRHWQTPPGCGLAFSLGLGPGTAQPPNAFLYPLFAGVVWHQTLRKWGMGDDLRLKWPNDVLFQGRKLAGILCESRWRSSHVHTVIGIGTNLHPHPALRELPYPVACLAEVLDEINPADLVAAALETFRISFDTYANPLHLRQAWLERAWIEVGQAVQVQAEGSSFTGQFAGLSPEGALSLQTQAGTLRTISPSCTDFQLQVLPSPPNC